VSDDTVGTTPEQFAEFEAEVRRVWGLLGMSGWDLFVTHEDIGEDTVAQCTGDGVNRRIQIFLNTKANKRSLNDVKRLARHEACHAFLHPLAHYAACRFICEDEKDAAEHEVVMRLMALLERL
jgi:hypothetical protein